MIPDPSKGLFEPKMYEKSIEPSDILQGNLGDCWFLCAVSCIAEMPHLVERLFITKEYNEEGIYRVKLFKNGEWMEIVLDDYFPCLPYGGPIFSRGHGNELWVLLLEKAYAKIHGSYKNIVAGKPHEALMDLTGCPTTSYSFKDEKV
jgi:calpain-15